MKVLVSCLLALFVIGGVSSAIAQAPVKVIKCCKCCPLCPCQDDCRCTPDHRCDEGCKCR